LGSLQDRTFYLVLTALGGFVLLFIIAPLLGMVLHSSPADIVKTVAEQEVRTSILLTLGVSLSATLFMAIPAIGLAWLLARKDFPLKRVITAVIDLPIVIPHSAAGIAVLGIISRDSLIGSLGNHLGIEFVSSAAGIAVAMAYVSLPFLVNAAREGFHSVPERLEKAALNLGASPVRMFLTISLPLAWRSILAGLVLMWARGMSEFGAVIVVAYHPMVTPVLIYERFGSYGLQYARPVAVIFVGVCLAAFMLMRLLVRQDHHASR